MSTEYAPPLENTDDSYEYERILSGRGFNRLGDALAATKQGLVHTLRERRRLFLVAIYDDRSSPIKELLKEVLVESLDLHREEAELVTPVHTDELNNRVTGLIMADRSRPVILPVVVGRGENPTWTLGPLWMLYTDGNVSAFRRQFQELQQ